MNDRGGPTKAKMAGKKEAKRKAGPSGQKEKHRKETEGSERTKNGSRKGGRREAQKARLQPPREQAAKAQEEECRSATCILAHGVGMPHDRVHGALPCSSGVQFLSISLSEGESEKGEGHEALRGLSHLRALYASQKLPLQKGRRRPLSHKEMRERPPPPAA